MKWLRKRTPEIESSHEEEVTPEAVALDATLREIIDELIRQTKRRARKGLALQITQLESLSSFDLDANSLETTLEEHSKVVIATLIEEFMGGSDLKQSIVGLINSYGSKNINWLEQVDALEEFTAVVRSDLRLVQDSMQDQSLERLGVSTREILNEQLTPLIEGIANLGLRLERLPVYSGAETDAEYTRFMENQEKSHLGLRIRFDALYAELAQRLKQDSLLTDASREMSVRLAGSVGQHFCNVLAGIVQDRLPNFKPSRHDEFTPGTPRKVRSIRPAVPVAMPALPSRCSNMVEVAPVLDKELRATTDPKRWGMFEYIRADVRIDEIIVAELVGEGAEERQAYIDHYYAVIDALLYTLRPAKVRKAIDKFSGAYPQSELPDILMEHYLEFKGIGISATEVHDVTPDTYWGLALREMSFQSADADNISALIAAIPNANLMFNADSEERSAFFYDQASRYMERCDVVTWEDIARVCYGLLPQTKHIPNRILGVLEQWVSTQGEKIGYQTAVRALSGIHGCMADPHAQRVAHAIFVQLNESIAEDFSGLRLSTRDGLLNMYALYCCEMSLPEQIRQNSSRILPFDSMYMHEKAVANRVHAELKDAGVYVVHPQSVYGFELDMLIHLPDGRRVNVEIDGPHHAEFAQRIRDKRRDEALKRMYKGLEIVRIPMYQDLKDNYDGYADMIVDEVLSLSAA